MTGEDEIDPDELAAMLERGEAPRIVDIRGSRAFASGHIPGSENVPFARLPTEVERFDEEEHIVTVCPHGQASLQAVRLIRSYEGIDGARVESLAGGLEAWDGDLVTD